MIHIVDRNNKVNQIFAFQKRVKLMKQVKPNFLIAIGDDSNESKTFKKIFLTKR
jgi:hypothetical protein